MRTLRHNTLHWFPACAFIALYLLFDWATYIDPLHGLNITPWNPDPALGMVFWLRYGKRAALPWFVALLAGEVLVRGVSAGLIITLLGALWLTLAYGVIGEALRRRFSSTDIFDNSHRLFAWVAIVVAGSVVNGVVYVSLLTAAGLVPRAEWTMAVWRFSVGDTVGLVVSMPLIWMLASAPGRARLRERVSNWETPAYLALAIGVLWLVFGFITSAEFKHFHFLFLPLIWAASRQSVYGAALMVFVLQTAIVALVKWTGAVDIAVDELQMLDAMMALVGFFIGIAVDERRQAADDLKHTLRLAAAGEMAAALAHELNQPLTALAAYGKACEHLLARGDTGELLQGAIARMVVESGRAAEVVRRLRDFFRTGAMRLEALDARVLVSTVSQQFVDALREHGVELAVDADALAPPRQRQRCMPTACKSSWCCATCWPTRSMPSRAGRPGRAASASSSRRWTARACSCRSRTAARACRRRWRCGCSNRSSRPRAAAWASGWCSAAPSPRRTAAACAPTWRRMVCFD